jgi:peptide-methionine (R)-S-oxide reductase
MNRREFLPLIPGLLAGAKLAHAAPDAEKPVVVGKLTLDDADWKKRLTPEQYNVLRQAGTERAGTSALNGEKRKGLYHCAGCDLPLFSSEAKYDSGTGWPSFTAAIAGRLDTRVDRSFFGPVTEYHCARCAGHQGHVFDDGPKPAGKRYCNNGVALKFVPA